MSSLPSINIASDGKFQKVFHFDQKQEIERMAREELPATFVHPGIPCSFGSWGTLSQLTNSRFILFKSRLAAVQHTKG